LAWSGKAKTAIYDIDSSHSIFLTKNATPLGASEWMQGRAHKERVLPQTELAQSKSVVEQGYCKARIWKQIYRVASQKAAIVSTKRPKTAVGKFNH